MNTITVQRLRSLSALTVAIVALAVGSPPMPTGAATGVTHPAMVRSLAGPCDSNSRIEQATSEYRQFYDPHYSAAQQIAATTNEYRQFYDPRYSARRQMAQTTSEYCSGNR